MDEDMDKDMNMDVEVGVCMDVAKGLLVLLVSLLL